MFPSFFSASRPKRRSRTFTSSSSRPIVTSRQSFARPEERHSESSSEGHTEEEEQHFHRRAKSEQDSVSDFEEERSPLLPIFDSSRLDALPIYDFTHAIRLLVVTRCETVMSWEQLRSPQVSQFMLRPIQQEIKAHYFSAGTIYCLMANCLQFVKEAGSNPGNSGTSRTRAMICELLAIRLLREYTTRGLIDVLSYDFDPLQGQPESLAVSVNNRQRPSWQTSRRTSTRSVRISCMEIAIRAEAKRFLAHPVVVQQLEAIWNGSIVFHSAADSLHRRVPTRPHHLNYGTNAHTAQEGKSALKYSNLNRKMVSLYNPRDASLLKLSRLRVPRYRNILSTMSFAVLLFLFVAVLVQRSITITPLEIVFWFWAAGYMLDEIVGFNEQGFGLYIASFWNTFDLGILILLFAHLCLRVYGILMVDVHKRTIANMAYDILAADAVLLFPRLFSILDHYRYFSQLIIAFRMMAADLMAVFILIVISCSGFFVALTLSFGHGGVDDPSSVAYALLQMLMGFTPAAWDRWESYTVLGRAILTLFLFICHFLVVTILITVLTNSFMAVVRNANEEHQFLFAVNTISNVKSDALFSYVAPLNIIQWLLTPLRYITPFRQYVKVNRTAIKLTHFPVLFTIYFYEKVVLAGSVLDSIEAIHVSGPKARSFVKKLPRLVKKPSVATFRQDQALEEVFRQPYDTTMRTNISRGRSKKSNVVKNWMSEISDEHLAPPPEQDRRILDRLERRRGLKRNLSSYSQNRDFSRRTVSVQSDPADMVSHGDFFTINKHISSTANTTPSHREPSSQQDAADGDDELPPAGHGETDDDETAINLGEASGEKTPGTSRSSTGVAPGPAQPGTHLNYADSSRSKGISGSKNLARTESTPGPPTNLTSGRRFHRHSRNISSATIIHNPDKSSAGDHIEEKEQGRGGIRPTTPQSRPSSGGSGRKLSRAKNPMLARPKLEAANTQFRSTPNLHGMSGALAPIRSQRRPSLELDMVSDIGDNKALGGGYIGAIPASIATQLAMAESGSRQGGRHEEQEMLSRMMMARMNSLEEGFREVIHEVRENIRSNVTPTRNRSTERSTPTTPTGRERRKGKNKGREDRSSVEQSLPRSAPGGDYRPSQLSVATTTSSHLVSAEGETRSPSSEQTPGVHHEPGS